jgi:hypothetical protein
VLYACFAVLSACAWSAGIVSRQCTATETGRGELPFDRGMLSRVVRTWLRLSRSSHSSPGGSRQRSHSSDASKSSRGSLEHEKAKDSGKNDDSQVRDLARNAVVLVAEESIGKRGASGVQRVGPTGAVRSPVEVQKKVVPIGRINLVKYQLREAFVD